MLMRTRTRQEHEREAERVRQRKKDPLRRMHAPLAVRRLFCHTWSAVSRS